jgi:hypothetical protein
MDAFVLKREGQMACQGVGRPGYRGIEFTDIAALPHGGSGSGNGALGAKWLHRRDVIALSQPAVSDPVCHLNILISATFRLTLQHSNYILHIHQ